MWVAQPPLDPHFDYEKENLFNTLLLNLLIQQLTDLLPISLVMGWTWKQYGHLAQIFFERGIHYLFSQESLETTLYSFQKEASSEKSHQFASLSKESITGSFKDLLKTWRSCFWDIGPL